MPLPLLPLLLLLLLFRQNDEENFSNASLERSISHCRILSAKATLRPCTLRGKMSSRVLIRAALSFFEHPTCSEKKRAMEPS